MHFAHLPSAKAMNENREKSRQATTLRCCMVKPERAQDDGQSGYSGAGREDRNPRVLQLCLSRWRADSKLHAQVLSTRLSLIINRPSAEIWCSLPTEGNQLRPTYMGEQQQHVSRLHWSKNQSTISWWKKCLLFGALQLTLWWWWLSIAHWLNFLSAGLLLCLSCINFF